MVNGTIGDLESSLNFRLQSPVIVRIFSLSDFNSALKETRLFSFYNNMKERKEMFNWPSQLGSRSK